MHLSQTQKNLMRHHIYENTGSILELLQKILSSHTDHEIILQAVKCVSSWLAVGIPLSQCQNMANILVGLVFNTHKHHSG